MTTIHPLLARETLVVSQKAKLFELRNEFALLDEQGQRIGSVQQVGQSVLAKVLRIFSSADVALPITLEVRDAADTPVLVVHKRWFRWTCEVSRPDGTPLGSIRKEIRLGKARFAISGASGEPLGTVSAQNWRAKDFTVRDTADVEIARVAKQWRGVAPRAAHRRRHLRGQHQPDADRAPALAGGRLLPRDRHDHEAEGQRGRDLRRAGRRLTTGDCSRRMTPCASGVSFPFQRSLVTVWLWTSVTLGIYAPPIRSLHAP